MNIWNGAFAPKGKQEPGLSKSIGSSVFIPLNEMSPADWRLLDWDFLSNTAKNNIISMALTSGISGFVHYKFVSKGSGPGGYLDPRPLDFDPSDLDDSPNFKNFGKDPKLLPNSIRFEAAVERVVTPYTVRELAAIFCFMLSVDKARDEGVDNNPGEYDENQDTEQCINYIQQIMYNDFNDYSELDIILTWVFAVLHDHDIEWLEEWAEEAEQILGDADDKGLL